ncbi:MAG: HAMP domain-containing histidine kinase [Chloroflexota bacterium]|nr:HAMP domain-containing histidine kinase [Chloroflexota bacterium]
MGWRLVVVGVGAVLLAVALVAVIDSIALSYEFGRYSRQQQDDRTAQIVASLGAAYEGRGSWAAPDLVPAQQLAVTAGASLTVYDASGQVVLAAMPPSAMPGWMGQMMRQGMPGTGLALGPERRVPVVVAGRTVGTAALAFPSADLPAERDVRAALARAQWTAALVAAVVALAFAVPLARRVARPVAALATATDALRRGERGARVRDLPADELGDLGRAFNEMATSLEREDALRRQVVADVAHELRTPLTSIQGHLEALRDGVLPADPPTLGMLHDEAARLGRLVADLETLARAEGAGFTLQRRPLDLADVARDVAAELGDAFHAKDVALDVDLRPARTVADEDRVAQIARNLLSNALKFTPSGGRVSVATRNGDGRALLEVRDTGIGMSADEAAHAFDRFWRAPGATDVPGSGIGLTIARELALAHGGDVSVTSETRKGSTFRVTLPASDAAANGGTHAR